MRDTEIGASVMTLPSGLLALIGEAITKLDRQLEVSTIAYCGMPYMPPLVSPRECVCGKANRALPEIVHRLSRTETRHCSARLVPALA
jgi:hypothetical protein